MKRLVQCRKVGKRVGAVGIVFVGIVNLIACTRTNDQTALVTMSKKDTCPYEEFLVVDVFDNFANYQGIQSGWFGELVKNKFNMELNIIAPNVTGGGDTLFEMRSAAGSVGDLLIVKADNGVLEDLVNAGLVYNMEEDLQGKGIMKHWEAIENLNSSIQQDGVFAIPSEVSMHSPEISSEGTEPAYGPYIRWDLYKELGYPKLETFEDLLPVLKQMQELNPTAADGTKTYGFSFFKEWDNNMMNAVKQPCCMYGYDEFGVVLAKADGSDYQSIIDDNSIYVRMLQFYFMANQMGLVDPESADQNYDQCFEKYEKGQVLFSPWPWLGPSAYNTRVNTEAGKGMLFVPIKDMKIYSYGCYPYGNQGCVIAVGSQVKDPKRLVDFIDWLYSSEGIMANGAYLLGGTAGLEGLTWEMKEGEPYLTEFGKEALLNGGNIQVPPEYGNGTWTSGTSVLNFKPVAQCEENEEGIHYYYNMWDSVKEIEQPTIIQDWKTWMKADTTMEYLQNNDMLLVGQGISYIAPLEGTEQFTIRSQCKKAIQEYSWEMIFAQDYEQFESLLREMQTTVKSYGYDAILEYDMRHAKMRDNEKDKNKDHER